MTTVPKRLGVKFSLKQAPRLQPADILPIFQRWIQQHAIEGMLIDVIDYKHVHQAPSLILIGDELDCAWDLTDGETGLYYIRKRALPASLPDALRLVFRLALAAVRRLQDDSGGELQFDCATAKISFLDRQHYRNQPAVFAALQPELTAFLSRLYAGEVELTQFYEDPRQIFAVRCTVRQPVSMEDLLKRLEAQFVPPPS